MDQAVERDTGHDVNEQTGDLVEAMEDHRVSPHSYGNSVVSECQTVGTDKESFRLREEPDGAHTEKVDEVTEVSQKVMISAPVIGVESNRHKVDELRRIPEMEVLGIPSNQIAADEDVQNTTDK
jgi:hypothetical protein